MKSYLVRIYGNGEYQVSAGNRATATAKAIKKHDKTEKGIKKRNGQKDKVGSVLQMAITRVN